MMIVNENLHRHIKMYTYLALTFLWVFLPVKRIKRKPEKRPQGYAQNNPINVLVTFSICVYVKRGNFIS